MAPIEQNQAIWQMGFDDAFAGKERAVHRATNPQDYASYNGGYREGKSARATALLNKYKRNIPQAANDD